MRPHIEALIGYAKDVVAKKIPAGKYVRLACKRHLDDLKRSKKKNYPYYFDEAAAERICAFAELLPHVKGKWARDKELIRLRPWQSFCLGVPFGWKRKSDGLRRFREIYDEIPRKNAKSTMGAIIGDYMLGCDGEFGAEVYSGATTEKQAWEVFRPAKQMLERATDIRTELGVEVWAKSLVRLEDESRFEPIIGNPGDGASPSCSIIDEYHEHDTPNMYDTMTTGMGAREQPMNVIITTAGDNIAGPCYNKHLEVRRVLEGVIENDELFGIIYSIDEKDDPFDPKVLPKANPNYDVSVFGDFLQAKQRQAIINTHEQAKFKTKHLNVWLQARAGLINLKQWQVAGDAMLKIEELQGEDCWFILDLAQKSDLCAFVQLFRKRLNGLDHWYCFAKHYLPEKTLEEGTSNQAAYRKWMIDGHLTVTDGATVDYETIKEDVIELAKRFNPKEIIYDPYNATHLAQRIHAEIAESIVLVEYPQTPQNMAVPMDEINTALKDARLHHDANPLLAWEAANTVGRPSKKGLMVPSKEKPEQKIDGIVALTMGFGRAIVQKDGGSIDDFLAQPLTVG